jgi:hypothetical protein
MTPHSTAEIKNPVEARQRRSGTDKIHLPSGAGFVNPGMKKSKPAFGVNVRSCWNRRINVQNLTMVLKLALDERAFHGY